MARTKLWTVARYRYDEGGDGEIIPETRVEICLPLPEKQHIEWLAKRGNEEAGAADEPYAFYCEEVRA